MEIREVYCDNCLKTPIFACVGASECYLCKDCYLKIEDGSLTLTDVEETRALRRKNK